MTRNDITSLFPDATKEQIDALLNIHSADVGKAKGGAEQAQNDLKAANEALKQAQDAIAELEKHKADAAALQKQIDDYRAAEADRKKAEEAAQAHNALLARMDKVMNGRKLIHDRMRDLIAEDFAKALADPENTGKSDADVFDAVTKDQNYFANQAPDFQMASVGKAATGDSGYEAQIRAAMGLPAKN